jgi:hypothetical protein
MQGFMIDGTDASAASANNSALRTGQIRDTSPFRVRLAAGAVNSNVPIVRPPHRREEAVDLGALSLCLLCLVPHATSVA